MIGIMGGTFNPVHYGHLIMCEFIREEFGLGEVLFIPAKNPPHKGETAVEDAGERLEMVRLAVDGNKYFKVSDIEMKRPGPSYTVETLAELSACYPDEKLRLIIGADSLMQLDTWKRYKDIIKLTDVIVAKRPDTETGILRERIEFLKKEHCARIYLSEAVPYDYSSTEIRGRVKRGLSIKYLVPDAVADYIAAHGLYRETTVAD